MPQGGLFSGGFEEDRCLYWPALCETFLNLGFGAWRGDTEFGVGGVVVEGFLGEENLAALGEGDGGEDRDVGGDGTVRILGTQLIQQRR